MRRQWTLIRKLLSHAETHANGEPAPIPELDGFSAQELHYHIDLCIQAGLVEPTVAQVMPAGKRYGSHGHLTWLGHNELEGLRQNCCIA